MDISKFNSDNFDPKEWVNDVFKHSDPANREQYATGLVTKLQIFIQEVAKSLDDLNGQIIQTMPKSIREIDGIHQETLLLQGKMKSVYSQVRKIEQETATAMDTLLTIDTAKCRMKQAEQALKEVDNWTTLTREIKEVFASGNPDMMVNRLMGMQHCLTVLGPKIRDYKERCDYLDRLKDQFISVISPSVVAAFASQSIESAQYFAKIFGELQRTEDLERFYQKSLKADLCQRWSVLVKSEENQDIAELMNSFYDCLLSIWFAQLKWCHQIFKSPALIICRAFAKALPTLDPSVSGVITGRLDSYDNRIGAVLAAKLAADNFVRSIEASFSSVEVARSSESFEFTEEIYKPFVFFVLHYQQYEQDQLLLILEKCALEEGGLSGVERFQQCVVTVFNEAFEALDRCDDLSGSFALPFLLKAYRTYFMNFIAIIKKWLDSIHMTKDELKTENWSRIQSVLSVSQSCGEMILRLEKLDESLHSVTEKLMYKVEMIQENRDPSNREAGSSYASVLLTDGTLKQALEQLKERYSEENTAKLKLLNDIGKQINLINGRVHGLAVDVILEPIKSALHVMAKLPLWSSQFIGEALTADLPTFSVAPTEHVTKVGQYLMTFAHYLEPYLSQETSAMCAALREFQLPLSEIRVDTNSDLAVRLWLEVAGRGLMSAYVETIYAIPTFSASGLKSLMVDIEYLCNVIEDLGLTVDESLLSIAQLLKLPTEALNDKACVASYPDKLVALVRYARK